METSARASFFVRDAETGAVAGTGGQFQDILGVLKARLNFTVRTEASIDQKFGREDEATGEWNGMVKKCWQFFFCIDPTKERMISWRNSE